MGISATAADAVQFASGRFLEGLQGLEAIALEPDGVARLETLLMETIDLFQHRIDAWATGIAYRRLIKRRRAGGKGLVGGYWGLLGRLRPTSITGRTDGYLQAPSPIRQQPQPSCDRRIYGTAAAARSRSVSIRRAFAEA